MTLESIWESHCAVTRIRLGLEKIWIIKRQVFKKISLTGSFLSKSIKGKFEKVAAQAENLKDFVSAFKLLEK